MTSLPFDQSGSRNLKLTPNTGPKKRRSGNPPLILNRGQIRWPRPWSNQITLDRFTEGSKVKFQTRFFLESRLLGINFYFTYLSIFLYHFLNIPKCIWSSILCIWIFTYFFIYPFITHSFVYLRLSLPLPIYLFVYLFTFLSTFSHLSIYLCIYLGYLCAYLFTILFIYSFISRFIFLTSEIIHVLMFMSVHFFFSLFFYLLNLSVQVYVWLPYEF